MPNRARLLQQLNYALRESSVGLLFVDLDGFRQVNDTFGHDAGDELLRQVSKRFSGCVREGDVLARLGGDEFIVLLPGASDDAALVAQRLEACLAEPFVLTDATVTVGASIGVATRPAGQSTAADLLREADTAMYRAKLAARATATR